MRLLNLSLQLLTVVSLGSSLIALSATEEPADPDFFVTQMGHLDDKVEALEKQYLHLNPRNVFRRRSEYYSTFAIPRSAGTHFWNSEDYVVHKYIHAENCFLGIAVEVYDAKGELVKIEEGPINLRKVTRISLPDFVQGRSLSWMMSFDADGRNFPDLYFESEETRTKAHGLLDKLRRICRQRWDLFVEHGKNEDVRPVAVVVPEAFGRGIRQVRYRDEDPTQKAALLTDGRDSLGARLLISKDATGPGHSIRAQYLIYMADESGLRLSAELIKRRAMGADVSLFIDALSPFVDVRDMKVRRNTKKMYHNLMAAGVPVYGFRCGAHHHLVDEVKLSMDLQTRGYDQRPHEKFWIVNDRKGIVGGMNVGNDYFRLNEAGFGYWRDQDVLVEGKGIIEDMINIYDGNVLSYVANYVDPRKDTCFNPFDPVKQHDEFIDFRERNTLAYELVRVREDKQEAQRHALDVIAGIEEKIANNQLGLQWEPLRAARMVHNRPKLHELHIENTYVELINNARNEVIISNAYFIPSDQIKKAIRRAAKRGVRVVIVTNSYQTNDVPPVAILARHTYKEIVDYNWGRDGRDHKTRAVELWEWTGDREGDGVLEQGMNHAKFMIIDRKVLFIGSYNLDPRSRNINSEVGIVLDDERSRLAQRLAKQVLDEDLKFCKRVTYRDVLIYRRPITMVQELILQLKGKHSDESIVSFGVRDFFDKVARYNEDTW